jgi:hypothetical protein
MFSFTGPGYFTFQVLRGDAIPKCFRCGADNLISIFSFQYLGSSDDSDAYRLIEILKCLTCLSEKNSYLNTIPVAKKGESIMRIDEISVLDRFEIKLEARGLPTIAAKMVMASVMKEMAKEPYPLSWTYPSSNYDEEVYSNLMTSRVNEVALRWIEENAPTAWFKMMFQI